jgi:hypothetical protein
VPSGKLKQPLGMQGVSVVLAGLAPGTTYHYRVVATNEFGEVAGPDQVLHTFDIESGIETCANAFVRKQVQSAQLPDCRAYELASAAFAMTSFRTSSRGKLRSLPSRSPRTGSSTH